MSLPHEIAEQQARCDEYNKRVGLAREAEVERLRKLTPLEFLSSVWQDPDLPMHTRLRAAAEACKYSAPQLKAIAQVTSNDMAAVLDRARARAASVSAKVISIVPKALPAQHDPDELKPDPSRSPGAQSPNGFRRRF
jgi:hypothetical protein